MRVIIPKEICTYADYNIILSLSIGDQFPDYALHVYLRLHYVDEDETPKQLCPGTKSPYG